MKHYPVVVYEDESLVAVNKPAGLLTIPDRGQTGRSLKELLQEKYGQIYTVHRLDKDTSGLVVFAKTAESHKHLSTQFADRSVKKYYLGVVLGQPRSSEGDIDAPIAEHPQHKGEMMVHRNGKTSHTSYKVLEAYRSYSLVSFQLHTGRTHQIRVHAKHIGHPLACDTLYGDGKPVLLSSVKKNFKLSKDEAEERPIIGRLALHAHRLLIEDMDGKTLDLVAEMPKEFRALMQQLKKL